MFKIWTATFETAMILEELVTQLWRPPLPSAEVHWTVNTTELLYSSSKPRLANIYPASTQADFPI